MTIFDIEFLKEVYTELNPMGITEKNMLCTCGGIGKGSFVKIDVGGQEEIAYSYRCNECNKKEVGMLDPFSKYKNLDLKVTKYLYFGEDALVWIFPGWEELDKFILGVVEGGVKVYFGNENYLFLKAELSSFKSCTLQTFLHNIKQYIKNFFPDKKKFFRRVYYKLREPNFYIVPEEESHFTLQLLDKEAIQKIKVFSKT